MMCPGYTFELQFHTPEGMAMKMGESHHLYEEVRSPKRAESERLGIYLQLKGLWDALPVCLALWRAPTRSNSAHLLVWYCGSG
jgi:hypothetical protein